MWHPDRERSNWLNLPVRRSSCLPPLMTCCSCWPVRASLLRWTRSPYIDENSPGEEGGKRKEEGKRKKEIKERRASKGDADK